MSKSKKKKRKQVIKEIEEMNLIIEFLTDNTVYYYLDTVPKTIGREDSYYDGYQDWCDKSYLQTKSMDTRNCPFLSRALTHTL